MVIVKNDIVLAKKVKRASGFADRALGLMFSKKMDGFDGLLLVPCRSVHTYFMRFSIDVVFLSRDMEIVEIVREMGPWRITRMYFRAYQALELKGGAVPEDIKVGDQLEVLCTS